MPYRHIVSTAPPGIAGRICRWTVAAFGLCYLGALALLAIGTWGLFGQSRDPLSAVFLLPLGLPWNLWLDWLRPSWHPWMLAGLPALNWLLLRALCRRRVVREIF